MWGIDVSIFIMSQIHKKLIFLTSEIASELANLDL